MESHTCVHPFQSLLEEYLRLSIASVAVVAELRDVDRILWEAGMDTHHVGLEVLVCVHIVVPVYRKL